jgi:phospholipid/cholesterol/gamma-HCH transport system ATP-binding protein
LIKCLVGLIPPDTGKLKVFGKDISSIEEDNFNEMRSRIGFLFQSAALYDSMTVSENLEFPLKRHKRDLSKDERLELIKEALENVGLISAIDKMPSELSGGMRKRVGLARTLILKPEIILYDEPTTGLDPITSREISELILEVQKKYKAASIIITHDMLCAKLTADRVIILNDGVTTEIGTFEDLKNSKKDIVKEYLDLEAL